MTQALVPDLTMRQIAICLGMTEDGLRDVMPELIGKRGFPSPDPLTGRFDPDAFARWRKLRNRHLFPELTPSNEARHAGSINVLERMAARR